MNKSSKKSQGTFIRTFRILFVALEYFVFYRINSHHRESFGERLRRACEVSGPVFVKIGQLLSTRFDLLSKPTCEELQKLLDEVPPFSLEQATEIIKRDFGKLPGELYVKFDHTPIASASISQVYKAEIENGIKVAVKIRRPGIETTISSDISILKKLVMLAGLFSGDLRHVRPRKVLKQLEDWLWNEVDFRQEVKNIDTAREYYTERGKRRDGSASRAIVVPSTYHSLCSQNVITMDFIDGVPIGKHELIADNSEYNVYESLANYSIAGLRPWFDDKTFMFHADPHPANILVLKHGRVGLLDLGLVGFFDEKDTRQTKDFFLAIYAKNPERVIRTLLAACDAPYEKYAHKLTDDIEEFLKKTEFEGLGFWFMEPIKIIVKHRVPVPYQLVLLGKTNTVLDGLANVVTPGRTTRDLLGGELKRALRRQIVQNLFEFDFSAVAYALSEQIKNSSERLPNLIDKVFDQVFETVDMK